jgi:hypothetical protein
MDERRVRNVEVAGSSPVTSTSSLLGITRSDTLSVPATTNCSLPFDTPLCHQGWHEDGTSAGSPPGTRYPSGAPPRWSLFCKVDGGLTGRGSGRVKWLFELLSPDAHRNGAAHPA